RLRAVGWRIAQGLCRRHAQHVLPAGPGAGHPRARARRMGTPQAQFADAAAARPVRAAAPRHRGRAERPRRGAGTDADGAAPGADPAESVRDLEKDKVSGTLREPDTWLAHSAGFARQPARWGVRLAQGA